MIFMKANIRMNMASVNCCCCRKLSNRYQRFLCVTNLYTLVTNTVSVKRRRQETRKSSLAFILRILENTTAEKESFFIFVLLHLSQTVSIMKIRRSVILILLLFFYAVILFAQTGKFYSTDKELSNSLINKVYQDKKGFLWVATEDGLNKFDGTRFSIYRHQKADSTSLKNNYVRTLYEDSQGNFWIGCINGLQLYDRATDSFSEIHIRRNEEIISPHITAIVERSNGELWFSTSGQGIISIKPTQTNGENTFLINTETALSNRINSLFLNAMIEDSKQNLWIATEEKGLFRYIPETQELKNYRHTEGLTGEDVSSILEDWQGNIFVGTLTNGLFVLRCRGNQYADKFESIPYANKKNLNIKTLMLNKQGVLYIGTDGDGLKEYDAANNRIIDREINTAPFDFSKSKVHALLEDNDNNLWLGIFQKGLILIPGTLNHFNYYGYKSLQKNTIGSSAVMAILTDKEQTTWVGTDNDGLYGINSEGKQLYHYSNNPANPNSPPNSIMAIYEDSEKQLWLGSYFSGLAKINKRNGQCQYMNHLLNSNEKVSCITEDDNRNLWIGTYGTGIYKIRLDNYQTTHYESTRDENNDWTKDRLPNDWVNCILKGKDGLLWIGSYNGLACYNPEKNTFINYKNSSNLLPGHIVFSLLEASDGRIWIGTTLGLGCFDKKTEQLNFFTTEDGLSSDVVCGIEEDDQGYLWVSTYQGIFKFNPESKKIIHYYAADGLQGNEFSRGAVFKSNDGVIYFGGTNGITSFHPDEIVEEKKNLKITITEFYLANRAIKKGDKSGKNTVIDTAVSDAREFTISYDENMFSLAFSAMEFVNPERIVYQYNIKELGDEWLSTHPGVNRVTYTGLKPGKYTFSVRATDSGNYSDVHVMTILITPPWYQTTWAMFIWIGIALLFLYAVAMYALSRIRHRQELMKLVHQEEINEAKLQFFINISHEIRTPMTLIISPLEKLIAEGDRTNHPIYLMIYRNAQRILRLINQLLDIRKLDKNQMHLKFRKTDIVGFIDDLMQTFEYQAKKKNINFTFDHTDKELKVWIDLNNFDKVLLNVISNAFKYTPNGGEIRIVLTTGRDEKAHGPLKHYFEISISDTGIGVDKDKIEQIFERFYQINNDVTHSNFGTGIGLHLSRSLVELHHGSIQAENNTAGSGTRFIIRLPMGSDHLKINELENPEDMRRQSSDNLRKQPEIQKASDEIETEQTTGSKQKPKTPYKILVVEDDDEIRNYICSELQDEYRINQCENGKQGWHLALKEIPDLIISDVMMPEMDGIALSRKLKQNINTNHIPIVLLTARSKAEDKIEGLDTGADAYLVKPFSPDLLRTTVQNLIANRQRLKIKFSGEKQVEEHLVPIKLKSNDEILMQKIMKTINEHLANPALNVEMLAAHAGMSRVHMHRKLKELTNQSARDFIRNIRLKQAGTLLAEKKLSISEVAYATGFTSASHFSNSFKEFYGISPTEFKERAQ